MILQTCDIVLETSPSAELSKLIRFFEQKPGQARPIVSHAALVTGAQADSLDPMSALITEAEPHTVERTLHAGYDGTDADIVVFRPLELTDIQRATVVGEMRSYIGASYGYLKLLACAGDFFMGGLDIFRKVCVLDKYPICSWEDAWAFDIIRQRFFGVEKEACEPSDIWNWIMAHPADFQFVWQRGSLYKP